METNNLQLWDYVKTEGIECAQVSFIDIYGDIGLNMQDDTPNPFQLQDIEPIPLTTEILKANGFEKCNDFGLFRLVCNDEFIIEANPIFITVRSKVNHETMVKLHSIQFSVHKLQHILRICGLNELADNLKMQ